MTASHAAAPRGRRPGLLSRLSLRTRLTLLVAVAVGLAVALTSVAAYVTVRRELHHQLDRTLVSRAQAAVHSSLIDPRVLAQIPSSAIGSADLRIALVQSNQVVVSAMAQMLPPLGEPELGVARGEAPLSLRSATQDGLAYRVVAVPAQPGSALVFAQSTEPTEHELHRLGMVLLVVGGAGIVLAASAGLSIARGGLRPVERLTAATEHVARTEELRPIAVESGENDELSRLARSFNAMLAALAQSRLRQQQLVADAGHELRTPLTSMRTNLDLLSQSLKGGGGGLASEERDALLGDVRAQVEEMSGLVSDLVELARGDAPAAHYGPVNLSEVTERALDRVRRRAPGVHFDVHLDGWQMHGDAAALERAVTNLLDNAAKWSPTGGTVRVWLRDGVLQVSDEGPGIAESDLPHVFERFYRAPEARGLPGSGLGLAIVKQVVERHGGTVGARRAPSGGALLMARFPGWVQQAVSSAESLSEASGFSQARR